MSMSAKQRDVQVVSFGCRLNAFESDVMQSMARGAGLANAILVNTCAVTAEAERQARQAIRRLRRENPDATIVVTGCSAQIKPERYRAMPEVSHVLANDAKLKEGSYQRLAAAVPVSAQEAEHVHPKHLPHNVQNMPRGFLSVQNGCDHRCTFCIIPYGRGPSRSLPIGDIAAHLRQLVANGYNEVVLTGVDIASYGADLPGKPSLGQMLRRVLALVPELPRLRLSSLDPAAMDEDLWHAIAQEPRLMPHLHLSLQAGDDMVLKRMKRRHLREDIFNLVARARNIRPDTVFGADIIAGFPTEDEAMFANTLQLVEACDVTWLHVFPYSAREGTPAARMPQVPVALRKARAAQLRAAGDAAIRRHLQKFLGHSLPVLMENNKAGMALGRTPHFAEVLFHSTAKPGSLVEVTMENIEGLRFNGTEIPFMKAA